MKTLKCPKCGSVRLTLKYVLEEKKTSFFNILFFWVLGIATLGLYFLFYLFAEKRRAELGSQYYECTDCHFKAGAHRFQYLDDNFEEAPKEELSEEEKEEIREIGKNPVNMETWRDDRAKALHKKLEKRENMQNDE